jgi:dTDP-4-dehydrorhamnose 3,5-epimerase-like enzyme
MIELTADETKQVFVPGRCGHGFFASEEDSVVVYGQEGTFDPPTEMNVNPFEPTLGIPSFWLLLPPGIAWPTPLHGGSYIVSDQDRNAPGLDEAFQKWEERNKQ